MKRIVALTLAVIASGCGGGAPAQTGSAPTSTGGGATSAAIVVSSSGTASVTGRVTVSPTCPGPQRVDDACSAPLAKVQVLLLDAHGMTVGAATTSDLGTFEIAATSGAYRVQVAVPGRLPNCPVVAVTVRPDQRGVVEIACDSGMR